jgi:hypothetical protein
VIEPIREGRMKTKFAALMVVCGIALAPTYASAQVCAGGLIVAALIINATQNRELTAKEAATCGFILDTSKPAKPAPAPAAKSPKKKGG